MVASRQTCPPAGRYSAALCRGLIEAAPRSGTSGTPGRRIPRLYAAASLKQPRGLQPRLHARRTYSAALCRGLIEARPVSSARVGQAPQYSAALCRGLIEAPLPGPTASAPRAGYSAALCRGLIEACGGSGPGGRSGWGIPRLYAAASLKRQPERLDGLRDRRIPRLYAAASLKQPADRLVVQAVRVVFRGFMPRPH